MSDETPYNPPGMTEYIREGARKNAALLRKMAAPPEADKSSEAKGQFAPSTGSASDLPGTISITECDECGETRECITLYGNVHYCRKCSDFGVGRNPKKPNHPCSHCGGNGYEP